MATPAWSDVRSGEDFDYLSQKGVALHKKAYHIIDKADSKKLTEFLCQEGQLRLPLVELITHTERALDEVIDITGRAAIEAVLTLSARNTPTPSTH